MSTVRKCLNLWRQGGARAVARAVWRRLVYKRWFSLVFEYPSSPTALDVAWPRGYRYQWLGPIGALSPSDFGVLRRDGARDLADDLAVTDEVYAIWSGNEIASYGVVMVRSPQHGVLGLPPFSRLIGLCETRVPHRHRGLFSLGLVQTVLTLQQQSRERIFIEVDEANLASRAGIVRAGFELRGPIDAHIWFGRWVLRDGRWFRIVR